MGKAGAISSMATQIIRRLESHIVEAKRMAFLRRWEVRALSVNTQEYLQSSKADYPIETLENKLIIQWSDEDDRFWVRFPIFLEQQWQTHGDPYELAVADGIEALKFLAIADESIGDRSPQSQMIYRVA